MNLGDMCVMAARYSDRYDEYVKTVSEDGNAAFEGEALHWFHLFRDAINEAYFEISRSRLHPDRRVECVLGSDLTIQLQTMEPPVCSVTGVFREDGMTDVEYIFRSRYELRITGAKSGEKVILLYQYLPDRLEDETDEPIFQESLADPMIYVSLAVARIWQSERKYAAAQPWLNGYYQRLRELRPSLKPIRKKKLARPLFR